MLTKPLDEYYKPIRVVITVRVVKYKTKLDMDGKAVLQRELSVNYPELDGFMNGPDKIVRFGRDFLRLHEESEEYLYMLCLNTKLRMTSVVEISHGNVNSSIFGVREILQKALLANAVSIIMMHNHPSGNPIPSREDVNVTKRLAEAGKIVGIDVLDHIIIGQPGYSSLKEGGHI